MVHWSRQNFRATIVGACRACLPTHIDDAKHFRRLALHGPPLMAAIWGVWVNMFLSSPNDSVVDAFIGDHFCSLSHYHQSPVQNCHLPTLLSCCPIIHSMHCHDAPVMLGPAISTPWCAPRYSYCTTDLRGSSIGNPFTLRVC